MNIHHFSIKNLGALLVLAIAGVSGPAQGATVSVLHHWSFDSADASGIYDDLGANASPAAPVDRSAVKVVDGKFGKAIALDGTPNSYLTLPPLTNIQKTSFTFAAWVKLNTIGPNFILSDWASGQNGPGFVFGTDPTIDKNDKTKPWTIADLASAETKRSGNTTSRLSVARLPGNQPGKDVPLNEWHHLLWTWNRDSTPPTLTCYMDGEQLVSAAKGSGTSKLLDIVSNTRNMRIGSREQTLSNKQPANFNGMIDEIWIFDDVLTPIQRRNLINFNDIKGDPKAIAAIAPPTPAPTPMVSPTHAPAARVDEPPAHDDTDTSGSSSSRVMASGSMHRMSPMKITGVVFGLSMVITLASYLIWAVTERNKLRPSARR